MVKTIDKVVKIVYTIPIYYMKGVKMSKQYYAGTYRDCDGRVLKITDDVDQQSCERGQGSYQWLKY